MLNPSREYFIIADNLFDMICVNHMTKEEACKKAKEMVDGKYWYSADVFDFYHNMIANYGYDREE